MAMTDEELAVIRARADASTPGPWQVFRKWRLEVMDTNGEQIVDIGYIGYGEGAPDEDERRLLEADAAFIAHSRADIPALLAEVERLRAERADIAQVAVEVARLDSSGESLCYCWRELARGHHDTCWLMKAHQIAHTTPSGEMDG